MSRIGKQPIKIPDNVDVKIQDYEILIKGPKGQLSQKIDPVIKVELKDKELILTPLKRTKKSPALWGLYRALIFNMVKGVTEGFEKKLEIEGVGFRAEVKGNKLVLNVGLSHQVELEAPKDILFKVEKNVITVSGIDKNLVGQVAADVRKVKKPEPYKGKGIRYQNEVIRRKTGKKAATAA